MGPSPKKVIRKEDTPKEKGNKRTLITKPPKKRPLKIRPK